MTQKCGTPQPENQNVVPNEKATRPTTNPTKEGYTFDDWYTTPTTGTPTKFQFNDTPITADTTITAHWNPIEYGIDYVFVDGADNKDNPSTYTYEDNVKFKEPTKEGYTFKGWYTDSEFKNPISEIPIKSTGDKVIFAKWEEDVPEVANYKTEHYKQEKDGSYKLASTVEAQGETNSSVTATPAEFKGFHENTKHEDRVNTATINADGSTVLKLYYDRDKFTVTFKPENGESDTEQIVSYEDKATEIEKPTKDGYEFDGWYYKNANNEEVKYDFDDPVTSDVTLIAKWEEVKKEEPKPTPTPTKKEETNTVTPAKTDPTTAKTILPYTGQFGIIVLIGIVLVIGAISYVMYVKTKRNLK